MSTRFRQVVLMVRDLDAALAEFRALFGSGEGDIDPSMSDFDLKHEVIQVGDGTYLEICAPLNPDAETTATKFLSRSDEGGYMAVIQVPSATALRERMASHDLKIPMEIEHHGNQLTQVHPRDFGTLLEADEMSSGNDWHYPALEGKGNTELVQEMAATDIAVADPADVARRWIEIFELEAGADGNSAVFPDGGVVRFVPATDVRSGVFAFDVVATDRERVGEEHQLFGVTVRFV